MNPWLHSIITSWLKNQYGNCEEINGELRSKTRSQKGIDYWICLVPRFFDFTLRMEMVNTGPEKAFEYIKEELQKALQEILENEPTEETKELFSRFNIEEDRCIYTSNPIFFNPLTMFPDMFAFFEECTSVFMTVGNKAFSVPNSA